MRTAIANIYKPVFLAIVLITVTCSEVISEDLYRVKNLAGDWKFTIGDDLAWSASDFDDSDWDEIMVPSAWENEGYAGYNGYAWYRRTFNLDQIINKDWVYLSLGFIDDADEVYLNGKLVGSMGGMQKHPETAYNIERKYPVPVSMLNAYGENTIAVRVYDFYSHGGITSGRVGLYYDKDYKYIDIDLSGKWWFETEDEIAARIKDKSVKPGNKVYVPAYWESQGYNGYDGKARYSKEFIFPKGSSEKDLYMILGYIDDIETVYINGKKIGSVSKLDKRSGQPYYKLFRAYPIPEGVLKEGKNEVSVLVYDRGGPGGILRGPVGITSKSNYKQIDDSFDQFDSLWDLLENLDND